MPTPDPVVGDRVVVRYRLSADTPADWRDAPNPAPAHGPTLSDVTGVLVSDDGVTLVVSRDGVDLPIPRAAVTSVRTLSRTVVRNSQIRDVERALCAAVGGERAEIDGWLLQSGGTGVRGDLAVPVEFGASSATLQAVRDWFTSRGAEPRAMLPDRLVRPGSIPVVDDRVTDGGVTGGGVAIEVLVGDWEPDVEAVEFTPGRWAATVVVADSAARERARNAGLVLHHTGRIHRL